MNMKLFEHQKEALLKTENQNRVAYYYDMGLGKTFIGSEKVKALGSKTTLVICQKSKVEDWVEHFRVTPRDERALVLERACSELVRLCDIYVACCPAQSRWQAEVNKQLVR